MGSNSSGESACRSYGPLPEDCEQSTDEKAPAQVAGRAGQQRRLPGDVETGVTRSVLSYKVHGFAYDALVQDRRGDSPG